MITFQNYVNYTLGVMLLTLLLFTLVQAACSQNLNRKARLGICLFTLIQFLCTGSNLMLQVVEFSGGPFALIRTLIFLQSLFSVCLLWVFSAMLSLRFDGELKKSRLFHSSSVLFAIYTALLITAEFTTFLYDYTSEGKFHRGPWYILLLIPPALNLVIDLFALLKNRKNVAPPELAAFFTMLLLPLAAVVLKAFFALNTILIYSLAIIFLIFITVFFRRMSIASKQQQEELDRQRAVNLVLQMRPHFIYNTMMSIYYLCAQDPTRAQQVILDFSSYLQKSFSALSKEGTVPFSEELEHTRSYLAVEQVRLDDRLSVTYNIPCKTFRLPPLTLQPIVENAVKHGIDPEHPSIRISISTEETPRTYKISIKNNGASFDPKIISSGGALGNVRRRLKASSRGELSVFSREDVTVATITIPKKNRKQ